MSALSEYLLHLIQEKDILPAKVIEAARLQVSERERTANEEDAVIDTLIQKGHLSEKALTETLAEEFGMELATIEKRRVPPQLLLKVDKDFAQRHSVFPLADDGKNFLLAIANPLDTDPVDSLSHLLGMPVETRLAPKSEIEKAIHYYYEGDPEEKESETMPEEEEGEPDAIDISAGEKGAVDESEAPIIRYVHRLITEAVKRRASDIHLEPLEKKFRVRFRIDGILIEVENPPKRLQAAILARIKIMASISIAEKRIPQDGRIPLKTAQKEIDLRVSTIPTVYGESIVMRILDQEGLRLGLPQLGFFSDDQETFERLITLPDGIILVTGPTGSGKTTTLYSCLNYINHPDRKIITVEDPVEYQLAGVNQVQVHREVGMDFASVLRAMLRQAPNIIMIGEIRDLETAEIATNASLTGHMVFSTLHTNDAPSAVSRLIDIGIKPFLVSASLRAAMAQRLVRLICEQCKKAYVPEAKELRAIGIAESEVASATFRKGLGCPRCHGRGYYGRSGIFEILLIDEELQRMIYEHASLVELRRKAYEKGMRTMRADGIRKVISGITTIDEVLAVTVNDELST